jgi:hypothetical protein
MTLRPFRKKRTTYEVAPRWAAQVKTREGTNFGDTFAGNRPLFSGLMLLADGTFRAAAAFLTGGGRVPRGLLLRGVLGDAGRTNEGVLGLAA